MKKILSLTIAALLTLSLLFGCSTARQPVDAEILFQHLLQKVTYDAPLKDAGEMGAIYFPNLPQDTVVRLCISSSGYFPDEVAWIKVNNEKDIEAAKASMDAHIAQVRNQFQNYLPEEVATIDAHIIWNADTDLFLVITSDTETAQSIFDRAHDLSPLPPLPTTEATTAPTETTAPPTEPTTAPIETTAPPETEAPAPVIPTLTSKSGIYSVYPSGVLKVDNAAYEPYGYDGYVAGTYAAEVSEVADALAGFTNVYCLPIPTAISVILPDDIIAQYPKYHDQGAEIEEIFAKMSSNVIGINCYQNLMQHRDEYLYYRTDYHWNGPAAYYAYEVFCNEKGIVPYAMEQREVAYFDNFLGILYSNNSGYDPELAATPDTVIAYYPYSKNATMTYTDTKGISYAWPIINDVSGWGSNAKYLCYAAADQPYAEFHNPDVTDGSVLIVVKESYGNVLMSYLVDHYSTIYEIDYRYWQGSLIDFARQVGATDLLFANNMTMISAGVLVGMLSNITH